jgi:hypothetical protein
VFTLFPTSMGEEISLVSRENAVEAAVPYLICVHSMLLYLNLCFWKKILAGHIINSM